MSSLARVQSQNCDSQYERVKQNRQNVTTQPHPRTTRVKGQSGKDTIFSTENKILTPHRSRLLPENVEATLCTKSWLYGFEGNLIFFYSHNYTILILY